MAPDRVPLWALILTIVIPTVYFSILSMLIGLIFRGAAYEFRHLSEHVTAFLAALGIFGMAYLGISITESAAFAFRQHDDKSMLPGCFRQMSRQFLEGDRR
ncbi:MAG: hypothetical protein IT521_05640 [Burkholderiales bacterium]|nr:hypothetical protein [Burkholderiales bacterium]